MTDNHEMIQVMVYETGVEEWTCRECGRHLMIQTAPFKRIVLVNGSEDAAHFGGSFTSQLTLDVQADTDLDKSPHISHIDKGQLH